MLEGLRVKDLSYELSACCSCSKKKTKKKKRKRKKKKEREAISCNKKQSQGGAIKGLPRF